MNIKSDNIIKVKWRCPSNIAIVKYWGKKENQIPCNASLSMTLENAHTVVEAEIKSKKEDGIVSVEYYFEGEIHAEFGKRVESFIEANVDHLNFARRNIITIKSNNSFPHSAGIASSASAFGAIALALLEIQYILDGKTLSAEFYNEASYLARLGSGSASRSIFSGYAVWGKIPGLETSSFDYAIQLRDIHPIFKTLKDAILIVEDEPKKVSSSAGHSLMNNHPYAKSRFIQADERVNELVSILETGDFNRFISICESEALTLHAMMMTSKDYYLLFKPNTITIIEKIITFRNEKNIQLCFTLDAGPNVHLLYPKESAMQVEKFIKEELMSSCKSVLFDEIGVGPIKLQAE